MKCANCINILITPLHCSYCPFLFCSLSCLESHYLLNHNINLFNKNESGNNINFHHSTQINSIFLVKGVLNQKINYSEIYNLNNFIPVYQNDGKLKIIGSGSYGQVYLGQNIIDKKYYAIKHMDKKIIFSILNSLLNIQKEIDIQSKISHLNIVKLLYVKETETSYDLIMEYAQNGNLFYHIRKNESLSEDESFSIFIQVINAVNFLHENDLIHRDIKPENILLFENNVVKLCDFGWCVKLNGYQRGTFCGTTEYMSPELVNHQGYGKENDTWSLGVLLYEMIHGYSPFKPDKNEFSPEEVIQNIINHNLTFNQQVSERCRKLIYGLLNPNINDRYTVKDIFNSEFVKYYENIEKNKLNEMNNTFNNNYYFTEEKKTERKINNILYSPKIEMNNNINIHMSMDYNNYIYNIQIPERNNSYDYLVNNKKAQERNVQNINKGIYIDYIKGAKNYKNNKSEIFHSNDNRYDSKMNKIINFDNYVHNMDERRNKNNEINLNKTENNYYNNNFIKHKETKFDLIKSYENKEKEKEKSFNFNNNCFIEAKNYIKNKSFKNKNKTNIDESKALQLSYISYNKYNYDQPNIAKVTLIKKSYLNRLNNLTNDFNSKLSLSSFQTPEKNFSEMKDQNNNSIIFCNIKTPIKTKLRNENPIYKSYIKASENNIINSDSYNSDIFNKFKSKSEISENQIEIIKEKEPLDNIQRKSPGQKKGVEIKEKNKFINNHNSNQLIKKLKKIQKNKLSSKSNNNFFKNNNFAQQNEANLTQQNSQSNNNSILKKMHKKPNNINTSKEVLHITQIKKNNKLKEKTKLSKYIYKPKTDKERRTKTQYQTDENNISESSKLYISTNSNDLYEVVETKISELNYPINENINAPHNTSVLKIIPKTRKQNLINKTEERRPTNNKKNLSKEQFQNSKYISNLSNNNKKYVKSGNKHLITSLSQDNLNLFHNINKSQNLKINKLKLKEQLTNIKNIKYKNISKKGKEILNFNKNGIKKIYIYNNQIKNINETEKNRILSIKINNFTKVNKNHKDNILYGNKNENKENIGHKKFILPINKNETNINKNITSLNNINEERNKTPEKKDTFNRVNPKILIESFKKELENKTKLTKIKYNIGKNE